MGKSNSWTRDLNDTASKTLDQQSVKGHDTKIPKEILDFFDIENMQSGDRKDISLKYMGEYYPANIKKKPDGSSPTLYWGAKFGRILQQMFPIHYKAFMREKHPPELEGFEVQITYERVSTRADTFIVDFSWPNQDLAIVDLLHEPQYEGELKLLLNRRYERDKLNRQAAIEEHGSSCYVCNFNFERTYGSLGIDYIEVHHKTPLSFYKGEGISVDPKTDLITLCANCHRMIHRNPKEVLSVEQLKEIFEMNKQLSNDNS